jgi:hypothetical protein
VFEIRAGEQVLTERTWFDRMQSHDSTLIELTLTQKERENFLVGPMSHSMELETRESTDPTPWKPSSSSAGKRAVRSHSADQDSTTARDTRRKRRAPLPYSASPPVRRRHPENPFPTFPTSEDQSNALVRLLRDDAGEFGLERRMTGSLEVPERSPSLSWTPKPIRFRDVNGIEIPIPYRLCKNWDVSAHPRVV